MADVITRFKLETTQYDSKLRDASKGLSEFTKTASLAGGEFAKFTQKNVDAARAFGNIATSATNSKDKVKELVSAFNDVAKAYNTLTKEQQQSDFGKALAESMTNLKGRIAEAKQEMNDTGGIMSQLRDKFVINIDATKIFNAAMTAASAALDVAKDAFFANEQSLDEWGRTVQSSESLYKGFLSALNTGDISGYINNIDSIVQAARDAYDALDELATFNAFNQINVAKARRGMSESIADFREGVGSKGSVRANADVLIEELRQRQELETAAYQKAVADKARQRGINPNDLMMALSGTYGSYKALKELPLSGRKTVSYGGGMFGGGGSYEQQYAVGVEEKLGEALRQLNDTELDHLQALGAQADKTGEEIAGIDRQVARIMNGRQVGSGGSGSGSGRSGRGGSTVAREQTELQTNQKLINDLTQEYVKLGDDATASALERKIAIQGEIAELEKRNQTLRLYAEQAQGKFNGPKLWQGDIDDMMGGSNVGTNLADSIVQPIDKIREYLKDNPIVIPIQDVTNDVKAIQQTARTTAQVVGTIGTAFNAIEDPAAKVAGTVAQAIATVALAYSDALAKDTAGKFNIWRFIAGAAAATISMVTTIASIHSATGYAEGGEIKGNSYSGDNIPIMANAGEIILNRAQQANVAQGLQGGGLSGLSLKTKVKGTELLVWLDNSLAQSGRGELVTWGT